MVNNKLYEQFWNHMIEADTILFSLGLHIDYAKTKRQSKTILIFFCLIHTLFFTADYFLITRASDHVFILSSFVVFVIYTTHNSCSTTINWFLAHIVRQRFSSLNAAMRNLQDMDTLQISWENLLWTNQCRRSQRRQCASKWRESSLPMISTLLFVKLSTNLSLIHI